MVNFFLFIKCVIKDKILYTMIIILIYQKASIPFGTARLEIDVYAWAFIWAAFWGPYQKSSVHLSTGITCCEETKHRVGKTRAAGFICWVKMGNSEFWSCLWHLTTVTPGKLLDHFSSSSKWEWRLPWERATRYPVRVQMLQKWVHSGCSVCIKTLFPPIRLLRFLNIF